MSQGFGPAEGSVPDGGQSPGGRGCMWTTGGGPEGLLPEVHPLI